MSSVKRRVVMLFFIIYVIAHVTAAPEKKVYSPDEGLKLFEEFVKEYNKQYNHEEKEERFKIFLNNLKEINYYNERSSHATFGITKFTDLTKEEFKKLYTGYKSENNILWNEFKRTEVPESFNYTVPDEFDWRTKGVVSRVKYQADCVSGWTFSATGNVESINAIKTGHIVEISEQQVLDCDKRSLGCDGGELSSAFEYLVRYGAMSSQSYPYKATSGKCGFNNKTVVIKPKHFKQLMLNEEDMKKKLYTTGPLSIMITATPLVDYTKGILTERCNDKEINHSALLVGYGQEKGVPFWLVKNSWGTDYGEKGYFRIKRGVNCLRITSFGVTTVIL